MRQLEAARQMSTTNETTYSEIVAFLNPHLHTRNHHKPKPTDPVTGLYSVKRAAPVFLEDDDKIAITKFMLQRDFSFNDAIFSDHNLQYSAHQIIENKLRPNKEKSIINVFYAWGYGYYHFLTEVLPNILDINKPHDIFLNYCKFAEPILRWFNIQNNIIYEINKTDYKSEITQPIVECGLPSPYKLQLIRSVVETKLKLEPQIGILIFRREVLRRILNLKATFEMIKECFPNIEWVIFDILSFDKTVELFAKAKVILAPHGAGLTNSIFCPTGTLIYELMPIEKPNLCYYHLSEMIGHKHYMIPHHTNENQQFAVNTARVSKLIKESLNTSA